MRLGLMAVGFAVGSGLLLSASSIVPGLHAHDLRRDADYGIEKGPHANDVLRIWGMPQSFGDVDIQTEVVEAVGDAPIPPGLPRIPAPGEIYASERLASVWSGGLGAAVEDRLHGHLVGTIGHEGVLGPDELSMWVGKPVDVRLHPSDAYVLRSFGLPGSVSKPLDLGALLIIMVITSAILLPIWLFVATVTRLSAATREARLAAVRLAGGTQVQVRLLAGTEAGVGASIGSLLGIPLFLAIRTPLAGGAIGGIHLFPSDLTPPLPIAIGLLVALPALATLMSLVTLRRIVISPVGVTRHAQRTHAGWGWVIVLAVGVGLLGWSASKHADLTRLGNVEVMLLIGTSLVCLGFGLVGTATWSAWILARRLAGSVRSVPAMLGMRRLEAEPTSVSRVVGGVALMIAMVGVVQSGLISIERSAGPPLLPMQAQMLKEDDVGVGEGNLGTSSIDLTDIPGVRSARWTRKIPFGRTGRPIGVIATDGSPSTLETIRDRLAWSGADIHTLPQLQAQAKLTNDDYSSFRRGAMAITLFLLLVSAATLLVAMVDWVMERRRSLAVLSAVGVSGATVRRSIFVQVALPLATSITFGVAGAIVITTLLYTAVEQGIVIPSQQLVVLVIAVVATVFAVTALSVPWLRIARRPELLREA
ncbi:MAG: hypothetical protein M3P43_06805 [Actinomycetota bacterium]|nr:hypothetical protein [Actinomycetota bacterium]